jgi:hypothetical protein
VLAVLLAAGVLVIVAMSRQRAAVERRERAAAAAVSLIVLLDRGDETDGNTDRVWLSLRNEGAQPVRLVSARVDFPGFRWVPLSASLPAYGTTPVRLNATPTCGPAVLAIGQLDLLVDVVAVPGTPRRLTLPMLAGNSGLRVRSAAQHACGMRPPAEAVNVLSSADSRSGPREAVLDLTVSNIGVLPLRLLTLGAGPALSLTTEPRLPLTLPPRRTPRGTDTLVGLLVRVRPTNCPILAGRMRQTLDAPLGDLAMTVDRPGEPAVPANTFDEAVQDALTRLARVCARP